MKTEIGVQGCDYTEDVGFEVYTPTDVGVKQSTRTTSFGKGTFEKESNPFNCVLCGGYPIQRTVLGKGVCQVCVQDSGTHQRLENRVKIALAL